MSAVWASIVMLAAAAMLYSLAMTPGERQDVRALAGAIETLDRGTAWELTRQTPLRFPTFHPQGLVFVGALTFMSSVELWETPRRITQKSSGYDRTAGRGLGHVFVMDERGRPVRDITLSDGDVYHPGGIDFDGVSVWVPLAQYRPRGSSIIYSIDPNTLAVHERFRVDDHVGWVASAGPDGPVHGGSWGSRTLYTWTPEGELLDSWRNPSFFVDFQDAQYLTDGTLVCSGIAELPQPGPGGPYELGGLALIRPAERRVLHEVPVTRFSKAGHVLTRNPVAMSVATDTLTLWAAPDDGHEGTALLQYDTRVKAPTGVSGAGCSPS